MAKKDKKRRRRVIKEEAVPVNCPFCKSKTSPDYKDAESLANYMSDRAKVLGKARTGICAKHQRRISVAIKRARHLGLLPYTPRI
ncbi:30S ribosomal protein S18 [Candidatus Woesebacteria bacterium RIFOXYB1_FULL_42_36]|uniref:Small ribosomal subunit protein bS18 n=3 Tax=Candidatus Woeseibacteriota TaxID=1752722 RepID=A0A837IA13_9BACT|nr:MAG: 30S ribosomal protein S18 [Candidatus Woesebacteria bacterium GW2011_GWB1_44_11]KKT54754.1 MAG: 30S ribosomal protein S18 [Candidatus Woesebacteria bacterium GW2011_GWA1_44_23]OGM76337.1 MAG: 30S ribosomal protein S18 [Candidatus Woesebacteria bacterium RIFOXYA1_FULL_43_16]OGM81530.1 MAG: 30S ribosomal protein S18 [Candidatus Woesebacteria bacterium RIFOXYB1_FULL_42_36]OGM84104.1 MAG: 30S ribosomal protein S18 [Candidatus Woesebacteria bacterium RIFOXYC1_FULL_43_18]OGM88140.1 MAG: 30S 